MPKKLPSSLPKPLSYLQPFTDALAKRPPDELNEDVDASRLEAALRKRLKGMGDADAEATFNRDRELLGDWLKEAPDNAAHWVLGYLLGSQAADFVGPRQPQVRGPIMSFDPPAGWKVKAVPFRLDLKCGKVTGTIMALDQETFEHLQRNHFRRVLPPRPGVEESSHEFGVEFGECTGSKYVHQMTAPKRWKTLDYMLTVPGGYVSISLGTMTRKSRANGVAALASTPKTGASSRRARCARAPCFSRGGV